MKNKWIRNALSWFLAGAMTLCLAAAAGMPATVWAEEKGGGKYVGDVFIAYGKTEEEAAKWLKDNGWEPVKGDFNAGKASFFDDNQVQDQNVAAVMGIKRTDEKKQAVTDMAVMNMTGGYSIADYESIVEEKKTEINEFLNNFQVVIDEYRANYNGEGSEFGKTRADLAYSMLNKFVDGGEGEEYAVNDTGMKLGDLFLAPTRQEGDEKGGDLQQIMLESSGPAMLVVEQFLALGADAGQQTWIERASGLTGEDLAKNIAAYVPEAEGQEVSDSAAVQYLSEAFGDTAAILSEQWSDVHEEMAWYEQYCDEHDLWPKDGEEEKDYLTRMDKYFADLSEKDAAVSEEEQAHFMSARIFYNNLYEVPYAGDWGETMGDFFNPAGGEDYTGAEESFLPMAAALSAGQKASMDFLSLQSLLMIGFGDAEAYAAAMPDIDEIFDGVDQVSVYTGVNRAAFRSGVALTSEALMEQNAGNGNAYDKIWDNTGIVAISAYAAAAVSVPVMIAGGVMAASKSITYTISAEEVKQLKEMVEVYTNAMDTMKKTKIPNLTLSEDQLSDLTTAQNKLNNAQRVHNAGISTAGRWMLGIGGALLIGAAIVKGVQMWKYYDRTMKPIPLMIVDQSDIMTYVTDESGKPVTDESGNQKKNIDFNTYEYYTAVKCNRPDIGEIGDWQSGVEEYKDHNCFDVADLNADMGQEWIALYTVKSLNKGYPILADSLKMQYGDSKTPEGCTKPLHLFTYTNAVDLGDTAWAFNNAKDGVYFFWDEDVSAVPAKEAASAFGAGKLALAGLGGLILGILGSSAVWIPKRRREKEAAAQTETTN